jgi:hypothetical protein
MGACAFYIAWAQDVAKTKHFNPLAHQFFYIVIWMMGSYTGSGGCDRELGKLKPSGHEGAQTGKHSLDNSGVVKVSAYACRTERQYRDESFAHLNELSSHGRCERHVHVDGGSSYRKYFCSRSRSKFVGMAIDDRLMLISEVDTIAAPRNGKGAFVDSETRQRARMVIYATDRRELQIKVPIGGIPQSVVYPARSDLTGAHA